MLWATMTTLKSYTAPESSVAVIGPIAMNLVEAQREVARLDGFLYGAAAMVGCIRGYSGSAYLIEARDDAGIEQALKGFYTWNPTLAFDGVERLERGLGSLEFDIRPFIVRQTPRTSDVDLSDLRAYLSFRVMDMLSLILDGRRHFEVFRLNSAPRPAASECVFFCIKADAAWVVLQFNDDIPYLEGLARET